MVSKMVKLQTKWDSVDASSWISPTFPLDHGFKFDHVPLKKHLQETEFTPAIFKHYISTALLILLPERGSTGLFQDKQYIHCFPEQENWIVHGYLLGKSEKAKTTPDTKNGRFDPIHPCWFSEELRDWSASCIHTWVNESHTKVCSH